MKYLVIAIGVVFGVIGIAANEIGKFIDDISPYDWNDFNRHDVGNDFDSTDEDLKSILAGKGISRDIPSASETTGLREERLR